MNTPRMTTPLLIAVGGLCFLLHNSPAGAQVPGIVRVTDHQRPAEVVVRAQTPLDDAGDEAEELNPEHQQQPRAVPVEPPPRNHMRPVRSVGQWQPYAPYGGSPFAAYPTEIYGGDCSTCTTCGEGQSVTILPLGCALGKVRKVVDVRNWNHDDDDCCECGECDDCRGWTFDDDDDLLIGSWNRHVQRFYARNRHTQDELCRIIRGCGSGRSFACTFGYFFPSGSGGAGTPPFGHYSMVYPLNPQYVDPRDSGIYAAQGYGVPMTVPLAPVVEDAYNYSWGIPSSRLTPISRAVP